MNKNSSFKSAFIKMAKGLAESIDMDQSFNAIEKGRTIERDK